MRATSGERLPPAHVMWASVVDWDGGHTWNGQPIPRMPVCDLPRYLSDKARELGGQDGSERCLLDGCDKLGPGNQNFGGWLRQHVQSETHFGLKLVCLECGHADRPDNFRNEGGKRSPHGYRMCSGNGSSGKHPRWRELRRANQLKVQKEINRKHYLRAQQEPTQIAKLRPRKKARTSKN